MDSSGMENLVEGFFESLQSDDLCLKEKEITASKCMRVSVRLQQLGLVDKRYPAV